MPEPAVSSAVAVPETGLAGGRSVHTRPNLRAMLREATRDTHEQLHKHQGFAAIKSGRITLPEYRALLARLLGFYAPFEAAIGPRRERSDWLAADLRFLGEVDTALPWCPDVPQFETPERRIGALYVAEGSALGGRELAGELDSLLGVDDIRGRQFFHGRGAATGTAWQSFNARLEMFAHRYAAHRHIISAAQETFETIERWLSGWRDRRTQE